MSCHVPSADEKNEEDMRNMRKILTNTTKEQALP